VSSYKKLSLALNGYFIIDDVIAVSFARQFKALTMMLENEGYEVNQLSSGKSIMDDTCDFLEKPFQMKTFWRLSGNTCR
jgi:hypothetical protein